MLQQDSIVAPSSVFNISLYGGRMWEDFTTSAGRSNPVTMRIGSATLRRESTMTNCEVSVEYDSFQGQLVRGGVRPMANTCRVVFYPPAAYEGLAGGAKYLVQECLRPEYKWVVTTCTCMQNGNPEVRPVGA